MKIRRGLPTDLPELLKLEGDSFEPARCESKAVIQRSLTSPHQEVWAGVEDGQVVSSLFLRIHKNTCRIYSIAVDKRMRGKGIGRLLLQHARHRAIAKGCRSISLEADSRNRALLSWYSANGYTPVNTIHDYYADGWDAVQFSLNLQPEVVQGCQ